jgi:hypothetical protein
MAQRSWSTAGLPVSHLVLPWPPIARAWLVLHRRGTWSDEASGDLTNPGLVGFARSTLGHLRDLCLLILQHRHSLIISHLSEVLTVLTNTR